MTDITAEERVLATRYLRDRGLPVTALRLEGIVRQMRAQSVR